MHEPYRVREVGKATAWVAPTYSVARSTSLRAWHPLSDVSACRFPPVLPLASHTSMTPYFVRNL